VTQQTKQDFSFVDRKSAIEWAKSVMASPLNYIVIDTETTGLDEKAEVVQFSAVRYTDHAYQVVYHAYMPSQGEMGKDASEITGITPAQLAGLPLFASHAKAIRELLSYHKVIAYKAEFDLRLLKQSYARANEPFQSEKWFCAMNAYAAYRGEQNRYGFRPHKLVKACKNFDIPVRNAHSATGDCIMTWKVIKAMAESEQ
jgi:DNA polymerase III epsilon subunit-like protein